MLLYRYQPINKFTLENLIHKKNWASTVDKFNDPFEFQLRSDYIIDTNSHKLVYLSNEEKEIRKKVKESIKNFGVVSYSETENNTLLWSHYSGNHKGMCLVFEITNEQKSGISKVNYQERISSIKFEHDTRIQDLLTTKSKDWSYEREYREIFEIGGQHYPYPSELKAIIFGCQAPFRDIEMVVKICDCSHEKDIEFSKMFIQEDTFNLGKSTIPHKKNTAVHKFWEGKFKQR
jgi:hypothetical protein